MKIVESNKFELTMKPQNLNLAVAKETHARLM